MKTKGYRLSYLFLFVLLSACASHRPDKLQDVQSTNASSIQVVDAARVAQCQYLDTVYGTSSWYGVFAEQGIRNARLSAMEKARELEGTHIVWEIIPQGYGSSQVAARVYRCGN